MSDKMRKGREGEQTAAEFLEKKGYVIRVRNLRVGRQEIDLVAEREGWMVFVEVKARSSDRFGEPEDFVDEAKGARIVEAADIYLSDIGWEGNVRFDIVAIKLQPDGAVKEVLHIEDAFY
jgi:putative endonuclease